MVKSYFINLNRRKDRLKKILEKLTNINFISERFEAFDGKLLTQDSKELLMFKDNTFNYRRGIMGAAISHINLWKKLIESDEEYFLIFEDDIEFKDNFMEHYNKIIKLLKEKNIKVLLLGFHRALKVLSEQLLETDAIINDSNIIKLDKTIKDETWGGLFAYIIHKDTAKEYVSDIEKNCLKVPIDIYVYDKNDVHIYLPSIVKSPVMTWLNKTDSDIQYDIISIFDNYVFFQYKDSPGYDIKWSDAKTFDDLKLAADLEPNCIEFNTYAWLKYDILHPDNFIIMPGMNSNAHGIYVKKEKLDELGYHYI